MKQKFNESYSQYCKRIENYLITKRKSIKLEGIEKIVTTKGSIRETDIIFTILTLSYSHNTIYSSTGNIQCRKRHSRSQGDLFLIARYYYPDITFEKVRSELFNIVDAGRASTLFCSDINKRVFYSRAYLYGDEYGEDMIYNDEYGLKLSQIT